MKDIERLVSLCQNRTVYIQTHDFPDPDAISSAFGLQKLLEHFGVKADICYGGQIERLNVFSMLKEFSVRMIPYDRLTLHRNDVIICVDSQKNGGNIRNFSDCIQACIDHHPLVRSDLYLYQDVRITGSCCTLIADYFQTAGIRPDRMTATALLHGIKMDTMHFTRGVTALDIKMYSYLHPLSDYRILSRLEKSRMELADLKAYGAAIENIELHDRVGFSYVPFSCPDAMIAILADFILTLDSVELVVVYASRQNDIRFSVRSENPKIHAGELIQKALEGIGQGGGHACMAGGSILRQLPQEVYTREQIQKRFFDALACFSE